MLTTRGARINIGKGVQITEEISQFGIEEEIEEWNIITVKGRESLNGAIHKVMPDRIEFGTYAIAAAMNNGRYRLIRF
jgi:UDP-N-acetylglucosamine 1-carboxyvinyltransferase